MTQLTKFQTIALPLVERGFPVTPARPDGKAGAAGKWQYWQYTTREQVLNDYVEKYADCNAGVVGKAGEGNLCFLDDDGGIPQDVIARLPLTYTVASRPDSSHRHFYFRQTADSVARFGPEAKNINIRDTEQIIASPSGGLMYKTLFDVKGIGGASLVIAAGSVKANGNVYTCVNDSPVADIPEWLVKWILEQRRQYHLAFNRIQKQHLKDKRRAADIAPDVREGLRAQGHADGFDVFPIDRATFVKSQAFKFARLGVTGDALVNVLIAQIARYVEGGTAYCETDCALESIRGHARQAEAKTAEHRQKETTSFYEGRAKPTSSGLVICDDDDDEVFAIPVSRRDVLRETIREFPDQLTIEDADSRLRNAMNLVGLEAYDKRQDKNSVSLIRKEEGFGVTKSHWTRISPSSPI